MKSKTKIMTIAAASLACIAVAGVGFASWVITNTVGANIQGSINVETVNDKSVVLTAVNPTGVVSFTHDGEHTGWLTQAQGQGETSITTENLTVTFTLTLTGYSNLNKLTATFTPVLDDATYDSNDDETIDDGYAAAITAGYITAPTLKVKDAQGNGIELAQGEAKDVKSIFTADATVTLELTFGWGTTFDNKNPAEFYNAHGANDIISDTTTYAQHANTQLTALEDMLNGVAYKITFTPTANA